MFSDSDDADELDDEEMDEVDLEADKEIDKDQEVSDKQEIQELADEVDADIQFFVGRANLELGWSAMLKVCG